MFGTETFSLPAAAAKSGLPIERLCAHAGIVPSGPWSTSDFFRLWATAEEVFEDRSAGLRFGTEGIDRGYGIGSIVALHAPDVRRALATLARYKRLTCPELIEMEIDGEEAIVRYGWLQANGAAPRLLVDTTMASLKELVRRGTGGRVAPIRLDLARRPLDQAMLRGHFGCSIRFGATYDAMVFDRAALDAPFVGADGGAFAFLLAGLEKRLTDGEGFSGLPGELRRAIARQLSEGRPLAIASIAGRLGLSGRTLQRRLGEHKTSFQQQLADVRRTVASRLLANTELDPVAIALLLGFEEPNSFTRAFRRWERTTPLRWRQLKAGEHAQA